MNAEILLTPDDSEGFRQRASECDCLPDCNLIEYEQDIAASVIEQSFKKSGDLTLPVEFVSLRYQFGSNEYIAMKWYASYGLVTFLSNCGGLLGLFLGVSALSIVEIFYFFVIRLMTDLIRTFKRQLTVEVQPIETNATNVLRQSDANIIIVQEQNKV
jgi:acid-sensing ion channel, other